MILQKTCLVCGHLFEKPYSVGLPEWSRRKYCSKECKDKAPRSEETRLKMSLAAKGQPSWNKGIPMRESTRIKLRKILKGRKLSDKTKLKMRSNFIEGRRRPWNKIGDGITPINERIRKSPEYKEWRKKVFERDDYTCQVCKNRTGDKHAHHIKSFAFHPELRFEVSNGITLCLSCHRKTDTYGSHEYYQALKNLI